jgi:flagellar motor switch/type III secretory pathway protein FliN
VNSVRPAPFHELPRVARSEAADLQSLRVSARRLVDPRAIDAAFAELVGETVAIAAPRRAVRTRPSDLAPVAVGISFAPADTREVREHVLVDVAAELAHALVARTLRQRVPRLSVAGAPPSPDIAGAFAALVHAALRRAHAGVPLRVVSAGAAASIALETFGAETPLVTAVVPITLGTDLYDARVTIPVAALSSGSSRLSGEALLALGAMPLALPIVLAACTMSRSELHSLRRRDAILFASASKNLGVADGGALTGTVALVAPRSERGLGAELAGGDRLVIRTERVESHPWDGHAEARPRNSPEERMTGEPASATLEVLDDAPVVVRVELGVVEMRAGDWAALTPGSVVSLARKLGDPVVLRVAGVEVARGELVQIEGELGVRITETGERRHD